MLWRKAYELFEVISLGFWWRVSDSLGIGFGETWRRKNSRSILRSNWVPTSDKIFTKSVSIKPDQFNLKMCHSSIGHRRCPDRVVSRIYQNSKFYHNNLTGGHIERPRSRGISFFSKVAEPTRPLLQSAPITGS